MDLQERILQLPPDLFYFALPYIDDPNMSAADIFKLYNEQKGAKP